MKIVESHKAPKQENPVRLSDYAVGIFTTITSRKGIKKAIEKNLIRVDSKMVGTGKFINGGEYITLLKPKESNKPILDLKLDVLFEDDFLAIVNKPAGLVVSGNKLRTLENALPFNLKKSDEADALDRPQPTHRLDFPTSGLLIVSKTKQCTQLIGDMFQTKAVNKTYTAIVTGKIDIDEVRTIDTEINGKSAKTTFKCIQTKESEKYNGLNLLELNPETGRRHQLRIHLFSIDHPILGDNKYFIDTKKMSGKGLFLHASGLSFEHPITKEQVDCKLKPPSKFENLFPEMA